MEPKKRRLQMANAVHVGDSRVLTKLLPTESISVTITSPPYFDLKDYGVPNQIGFGQQYEEYLEDLKRVFAEVFRATKPDGSLWIIVDTFRKGHEVLPLPFDLAAKLKSVGWSLRDIIIWKKERTLPWTHSGTTRKIFEYVLVFSKNLAAFKYDPDKYRDTSDLKRWWVRYPERYNPKGKALEEIWSYDIPTQGSWGKKYIRHFCPLPSDLVSRIVQLTTDKNCIVLDPFAGSGTVPTVSATLGRKFIGIELNPAYVEMFKKHLSETTAQQSRNPRLESSVAKSDWFETTINNLRIVKFGRLVVRAVRRDARWKNSKVYAFPSSESATQKFKHICAEYVVSVPKRADKEIALFLLELSTRPPLSKFGIQPVFTIIECKSQIESTHKKSDFFRYSLTNSHFHTGRSDFEASWLDDQPLFSPIKLEVEEPDG